MVVVIIVLICLFLYLRLVRSRNAEPRFLPKPLHKIWQKWDVTPHRSKNKYLRTSDEEEDRFQHRVRMREAQGNLEDSLHAAVAEQNSAARRASQPGATDGVNRNTSVRSVMTLPAYRPKATDTEQVLGREGERDGIDTVIELPTAEDEEAMREEEMDALYQIRLARRRQIDEREERRQERREARERRDNRALAEIRTRARIASEQAQREVDELRDAHDLAKQQRVRAVSSVSYHDVGLVRADGTRLRANSAESERMGLLSDAASITLSTHESSASLQHRRAPSSQSVLSIDTLGSNHAGGGGSRVGSPGLLTGHSRTSSRGQLSESYSMPNLPRAGSSLSQRAGSSPELIDAAEADLGDHEMPPHSPPGYDDVSLEEITPAASRQSVQSGRNSPYPEPPPIYSGPQRQQQQERERERERDSPQQARQKRLSVQMADLAAEQYLERPEGQQGASAHVRPSSRGVGGIPQLPSLRLAQLPQIVIEPSSARPRDGHEDDDP